MRIELYGIGLDMHWPQFEELKDRLLGYQSLVRSKLESSGGDVVDLGLIDEPVAARAAGDRLGDRGHLSGIWLEHCQAGSAPAERS